MKRSIVMLLLVIGLMAVPVMAQDSALNTVTFNQFGFTYESDLGRSVNIYQISGEDVDLEQPGGPRLPATVFTLYDDLPVEEYYYPFLPQIYVFDVAQIADYSLASEHYESLVSLLEERPDLAPYMRAPGDMDIYLQLPLLPVYPASQAIRAQAKYIETDSVTGISFITVFRQDVSPFSAADFIYTFQGLSHDSSRYISVIVPVVASQFPAEIPADFDYAALSNTFIDYLNESIETLNQAAAGDITPSPESLDALVQTFTFGE